MGTTIELNPHDLTHCLRRLPVRVRDVLIKHGKCICVSGGFIRSVIANEEVNDIDLFVNNAAFALEIAKELSDSEIHTSKNCHTAFVPPGISVQVIHRWVFDSPLDVIDSFDFTIARSALWWDRMDICWKSACDHDFYQDLAAKRLIFCHNNQPEPGGSILRILKFARRWYHIPLADLGSCMASLFAQVRMDSKFIGDEADFEPDPETWGSVARDGNRHRKPQSRVGAILTGLLVEVDPAIVMGSVNAGSTNSSVNKLA